MMNIKKIVNALRQTWEAIGPDILTSAEKDVISKDEVIEVVCDCDHVVSHSSLTKNEWDEFCKQPEHIRIPILLEAFPFDDYGW